MDYTNWIDRAAYPFTSHFLEVDGGRMHYLDQGQGRPVVFVHGTPTWSFLYRHLIAGLSSEFRCVAPDHIGFGLSDKPRDWSYRPQDHAHNLQALIQHLGLRDVTLVVHDFGGPIGLSYAVEHPENVRDAVLFNTWMWSLRDQRAAIQADKLVRGPLGKFLYTRLSFSPRYLMPMVMGDKSKLTEVAHRHYLRPFARPDERFSTWAMARELLGSSDWYDELWQRRERIAAIPALLLWGMKDPTFSEEYLLRWKSTFADARAITFPNAGHFVQEEMGAELVPLLRRFLVQRPARIAA